MPEGSISAVREVLEFLRQKAEAVVTTAGETVYELTGTLDRAREELDAARQSMQALIDRAEGVSPILPAYEAPRMAFLEARARVDELAAERDPRPALAATELLRQAAEALAALRDEHDLQHQAMTACADWQGSPECSAMAQALAEDDVPGPLQAAHGRLVQAHQAFTTSLGKPDFVEADDLRGELADALGDFVADRTALEQARLRVTTAYGQLAGLPEALATADPSTALLPMLAQLQQADADFRALFDAGEYEQAEPLLAPLADELEDFVRMRDAEDSLRQLIEDERSAVAALVARAEGVTALAARFAGPIPAFTAARSAFDEADKAHDVAAAQQAQLELKATAGVLAALRDEHDAEAEAKKAVDAWQATHGSALAQALQMEQVSPEVRAQLRLLKPLQERRRGHLQAERFADAQGCQPGLETVLASLAGLKPAYDLALADKHKTEAERAKLQARHEKASVVPPLSSALQALVDTFKRADGVYEAHCLAGRYADALAALGPLESTISGLEGATAEAAALQQKETQARADVKQARRQWLKLKALDAVSKEIKAVRDGFAQCDKRVNAEMHAGQYDAAIATAAEMLKHAQDLKALAPAHRMAVDVRNRIQRSWQLLETDALPRARALKDVTPDIVRDKASMEAGITAFFAAANDLDNEAARKGLIAVTGLVKAVLDAKPLHDQILEKCAKVDALANRLLAKARQAAKRVSYSDADPDIVEAKRQWDAQDQAFREARARFDADAARSEIVALEAVLDRINAVDLDELKDRHAALERRVAEAWTDIEERLDALPEMWPVNDALGDLLDRRDKLTDSFQDLAQEGELVQGLAVLGQLSTVLDELEKVDYQAEEDKADKAYKAHWKKLKKRYEAAEQLAPSSAALQAALSQMEADREALDKVKGMVATRRPAIAALEKSVAAVEQADRANTEALKDAVADYDSFKADYARVEAFDPERAPSLASTLEALEQAADAFFDAEGDDDGDETTRLLPPFKALVQQLVAATPTYDAAEQVWAELKQLQPELDEALDWAESWDFAPGVEAAMTELDAAMEAMHQAMAEERFADATAAVQRGARLDLAAKALLKVVAGLGPGRAATLRKEVDDIRDAHGQLEDDYDTVSRFVAYNDDLKRELNELEAAQVAYVKMLKRFEHAEALKTCQPGGDLHRAVQRLMARQSAHDVLAAQKQAELDQAKARREQTEAEVDGLDLEDLKRRSAAERVKLLADLAAQSPVQGLDKAVIEADPELKKAYQARRQREFKLLRSMELDPAFVKADEEGKQALVDRMRANPEMKDAAKNWNGKPPLDTGKRIAALRFAVETQCAIFGIDVPHIKTFCSPPDESGINNGYHDAASGSIYVNVHPLAALDKFERALDLVIHENAHNYQSELIRRLEAGELKPGDPLHDQAMMFAANYKLYIAPEEAFASEKSLGSYEDQPMERHSFKTGPDVAKAFLKP